MQLMFENRQGVNKMVAIYLRAACIRCMSIPHTAAITAFQFQSRDSSRQDTFEILIFHEHAGAAASLATPSALFVVFLPLTPPLCRA